MTAVVLVRYYAGARAAAGRTDEKIDTDAADVGELLTLLGERHGPRLTAVLAASSLLLDGVAVTDRGTSLAPGVTVEVLPPFAGG